MALPALPQPFEFAADPAWRAIEFISDLHLTSAQPATFAAWSDYLLTSRAEAIFILGDLFEVWVGDDVREPGRFETQACALLGSAASRRTVGLMVGNRDFLIGGAMLAQYGVVALADPTVLSAWGQKVLLSHGDALCLADTAYMAFRDLVRSPSWRASFLQLPLAERERQARQMRDASQAAQRQQAMASWADVDRSAALAWMAATGSHAMVHGHTHRPASEQLAPGRMRHVLSDWDCDTSPPRAQVLRLTPGGFERIDLPR